MIRTRRNGGLHVVGLVASVLLTTQTEPSIQSGRKARDRVIARNMDPRSLGTSTTPLTIESDWVSGCKPSDSTVTALVDLIETVAGSRPSTLFGNEIPRERWATAGPISSRTLVEENVTLTDNGGLLVYLLWVPQIFMSENPYGATECRLVRRGSQSNVVWFLQLSSGAIHNAGVPGLPTSEIERVTVIHEFGHALGLVADRSHAQRGNMYHCRGASCVMAGPTRKLMVANGLRAIFRGTLPEGYCSACWGDIRKARLFYQDPSNRRDLEERLSWQRHLLTAIYEATRESRVSAAAEMAAAYRASVAPAEFEAVAQAALRHGFPQLALDATSLAYTRGFDSPLLYSLRDEAWVATGHFVEAASSRSFHTRAAALEAARQFDLGIQAARADSSIANRLAEASFLRLSGRPLQGIDVLRSLDVQMGADPRVLMERGRCLRAVGAEAKAKRVFLDAATEAMRRAEGTRSRDRTADLQRVAAVSLALAGDRDSSQAAVSVLFERGWPEIALTTRSEVEAIVGDIAASRNTLQLMRREGYWPILSPCSHEDWAAVRQGWQVPQCVY